MLFDARRMVAVMAYALGVEFSREVALNRKSTIRSAFNDALAAAAALEIDGITQVEQASASWMQGRITLAATNGFAGSYAQTRSGVWVSAIAGEGLGRERDYAGETRAYRGDLPEVTLGLGRKEGIPRELQHDARVGERGGFGHGVAPQRSFENELLGLGDQVAVAEDGL